MTNSCVLTLQEELEAWVGNKLHLKINDNRSTMLSVKWQPDCTRVSLHRMFLQAPQNVMEALACYLKREHRCIAPSIKAYIEDTLRQFDYSHELDRKNLQTRGKIYDLQVIYNKLNRDYFDNALQLYITWFGQPQRKKTNRITFGLYHDPLKLIKINRLLDSPAFPDYFVTYVVYHEMLHEACPSYVDEKGNKKIHHAVFKAREKEFREFQRAQQWVKENRKWLFSRKG